MDIYVYTLNWRLKYLCDVLFLYSSYIHANMVHCFKSRVMKNLFRKNKNYLLCYTLKFFKNQLCMHFLYGDCSELKWYTEEKDIEGMFILGKT